VIVAAGAAFKVVGSLAWLRGLNRGAAGLAQVGKFVTVYPAGDGAAVELALALGQATRGLRGPLVPSDRPLTTDAVVSYRYGAFGGAQMQTRLGEIAPALVAPDGTLVPDRRGLVPLQPAWVEDPFAGRGLGGAPPWTTPVAERYRPIAVLSRSPGAVVQLGLDVEAPSVCILKRARLRARAGVDDPGVRLRREAGVLAQLAQLSCGPRLWAVVDDGDELAMVTEDLGGVTLSEHLRALAASGELPSADRVVNVGVALTGAVAAVHDHGIVHGDLKSANIVLRPDGSVRLIDFDLARPVGTERPPGAGTPGYTSPNCRAGGPVETADDAYALGAILYFLLTGAEPSRAPDVDRLLDRPPTLINPRIPPALLAVVERCLSQDSRERFRTASEVRRALLA
jgi:Protein kinase domain